MTKNEYIASIMLEATELLKEDSGDTKKKEVDNVGRKNSYDVARRCISQIQNSTKKSHVRMYTYSFNSFVKYPTSDKANVAQIECLDDNESRIIKNIIYDANEKMPNGYYLKAVNHNFRNKIDISIYLIAEK